MNIFFFPSTVSSASKKKKNSTGMVTQAGWRKLNTTTIGMRGRHLIKVGSPTPTTHHPMEWSCFSHIPYNLEASHLPISNGRYGHPYFENALWIIVILPWDSIVFKIVYQEKVIRSKRYFWLHILFALILSKKQYRKKIIIMANIFVSLGWCLKWMLRNKINIQ